MIRLSKYWLFLPVVSGIFLSACSTAPYKAYHGSERPVTEIAIIEGSFRLYPFLLINAATFEEFRRMDEEYLRLSTIQVLPGRHRLEFEHKTFLVGAGMGGGGGGEILKSYCLLEQEFLAGHRYEMQAHTLLDRSAESTTDNIYPATIELKISSPNTTAKLVTAPIICKNKPDYSGSFCKKDKDCGPTLVKRGFYIFANYTTVPSRCAPQAGYEYGLCEALYP